MWPSDLQLLRSLVRNQVGAGVTENSRVLQSFTLRPLDIVLPSQEDKDRPAIDLDLHLPFFCFKPQQLLQVPLRGRRVTWSRQSAAATPLPSLPASLQVLSCLLQEQRVVLFSADWARLTLVAECFLLYLQVGHGHFPPGAGLTAAAWPQDPGMLSPARDCGNVAVSAAAASPSSLCPGSSRTFPSWPEACWTSSWFPLPSSWAAISTTTRRLQL